MKKVFLIMCLICAFLIGCTRESPQEDNPPQTTPSETTPDVVTTASIVDNSEAFEKAISSTGTWLIGTVSDITFDKEITLDGEFTNGKKDEEGQDIIQRKVALYTQDDNRNVTARFTLTAPKFTINSPEASIQHGTFKGDLYISGRNFKLVDCKVDGNILFLSEEAQSTFDMDEDSTITGEQRLAQDNQEENAEENSEENGEGAAEEIGEEIDEAIDNGNEE